MPEIWGAKTTNFLGGSPLVAWSNQGKSCFCSKNCVVFLGTGKGPLHGRSYGWFVDDVGSFVTKWHWQKSNLWPLPMSCWLGRVPSWVCLFTFTRRYLRYLRCQYINNILHQCVQPPKKENIGENINSKLLFIVVCVFWTCFEKLWPFNYWKHCGHV